MRAPAIFVEGAMSYPPRGRTGRPGDWNAEPGTFWVYAIRSESGGVIYVGQTNDLAGRLRQHNDPDANRSLYTKRFTVPRILVHQERFSTRREAMARERFLKTGRGREWMREFLQRGASPPQAD